MFGLMGYCQEQKKKRRKLNIKEKHEYEELFSIMQVRINLKKKNVYVEKIIIYK